jgi:hypothetical protein
MTKKDSLHMKVIPYENIGEARVCSFSISLLLFIYFLIVYC